MLNVDTGNSCCLVITTDCIDGLTKSGHLQHECEDDEHDDHDDDDHVERTDLAVAEETEAGGQFGNGTGCDQFAERTADQLCTQSSDEGMQAEICNHPAVCKTDNDADCDTTQDTDDRGHRGQAGPQLGSGSLAECCGADSRQSSDRTCGQVDTFGQDRQGNAEGHNTLDGLTGQQCDRVVGTQEVAVYNSNGNDQDDQNHPDTIIGN